MNGRMVVNVTERRSRQQIRDETRRRLIDAAAHVFAEHGLAKARLEDICTRAGYTRGAFHWHFTSKEELLLAVLRDRMLSRVAATDVVVASARGPASFNAEQRRRSEAVPFAQRRGWAL